MRIGITTYMVIVREENNHPILIIFHIQEAGTCKFQYNEYSFYEKLLGEIGLAEVNDLSIIEVYINGYKETGPSPSAPSPGTLYRNHDLVKIANRGFRGYFKEHHEETQRTRSSVHQNKFRGEVEKFYLI